MMIDDIEVPPTPETPVRLPTQIREDAFFHSPHNRTVLESGLQHNLFTIPYKGLISDCSHWGVLIIGVITVYLIFTQTLHWMIPLAGGLIASLGITWLDHYSHRQQTMQRFQEEGYILRGEVLSCTASTDAFLPGTGSGAFIVNVVYHFTTPTGNRIETSLEQTRNDLNGKPLPLPGTPIYILYFNDHEHYLL